MAVKIVQAVKKATITFTTREIKDASQAILRGDWDNWDDCVMRKNASGAFSAKLNLDLGKSYQFGYLIDGAWTPDADLPLTLSPFGTNNSILNLTEATATEISKTKTGKNNTLKRKPTAKPTRGKKAAR